MSDKEKRIDTVVLVIVMMAIASFITYSITTFIHLRREAELLDANNESVIEKVIRREEKIVPYEGKFEKLRAVMGIVEKDYLKDYDEKKLEEGAIRGLLEALEDPYTTYFDKDQTDSFLTETEGDYEGVGMYVSFDKEKETVIVLLPIEGSPAEEEGVLPGDYILEVDGASVVGVSLEEVASRLKGPSGSTVLVKFQRFHDSGDSEIIEKNITRRRVELTGFKYKVLEDNIGYITFATFDENVIGKFKVAYEELFQKKKVGGLILDLRNNPGGLLNTATKVADKLLPTGKIVYTVDKHGEEEAIYSDSKCVDVPIVVLINENSASASEIMAAAIKDYGGLVVGKTSYGKGVVQEFKSLHDGTYVKVTISEYFSPKGNKIDKVGVEPDVAVEDNEETEEDEQLTTAIQEIKKILKK